jgi:hypothetical protein
VPPEKMETLTALAQVAGQDTFLVLAVLAALVLLALSSLRNTHNGFLRSY